MKVMNCIVLGLFLLLYFYPLSANNLKIENVRLTGQNTSEGYTMVEFDISWDNSWRDIVNWDAAWVFVKFYSTEGTWEHAHLDTNEANHMIPVGAMVKTGVKDDHSLGVFIYRNSNGSGPNNWDNVQLRWDYGSQGVADNAMVTIKVFAIEMVYVPESIFYVGDEYSSFHLFRFGPKTSYRISSQSSILVAQSIGKLWADGQISSGSTAATFPTGYEAFYCMKYEITQEQYVDFLNSLTRTQQNTRTWTDISGHSITNRYVMTHLIGVNFRNSIRCDALLPESGPIVFYCDYDGDGIGNEDNDGQNIVCNYLNWMDGCAYADWAGLRPMTELEFEKACRGDQAVLPGEYGNIYQIDYTLNNEGSFNEVIASQPVSIGNAIFGNTYRSINGPLRAGIFALSSTSRQEAGASYYGIMELSGNLCEQTVTIGNNDGRNFQGNHGDGKLSTNGNAHDVNSWPGIYANEVIGASGSGYRGGYFRGGFYLLRISDRAAAAGTSLQDRDSAYGFRCVRSEN